MKHVFNMLFTVCAMGGLPVAAYAQSCSLAPGGTQSLSISLPATLTIPRDAVVGREIGRATSAQATNANNFGVICSGSGSVNVVRSARGGALKDPATGIIPTGIPGIGYRVFRNYQGGTVQLNPASGTLNAPVHMLEYYSGASATVVLTKTGNITGTGTIAAGALLTTSAAGRNATITNLNNAVTIVPQTCQVTTPNVSVNLTGPNGLPQKTFTGVGSATTAVPFNIGVNCSGVAASVYMTLTDQQTPGNTGNTLALSSNSTASGLGIQIFMPSRSTTTPLNFGPDASVAGNTNQFSVFTASGANTGVTNIALSARYIQTAATVTPGTAKGVATFTMSYQ